MLSAELSTAHSNRPIQATELLELVLKAFAERPNWGDTSEDESYPAYNCFNACSDPALLAQAALDGNMELVNTLLAGESLDPFNRELQNLLAVQREAGYKAGWVLNQLFKAFPETTLTRDQWTQLGNELEYRPGWAYQQWEQFGGSQS